VQTLLEYGADPRLYAEDGQTPEQIAPSGALQTVLHDWDIAQTDRMLEQMETERNRRLEEERQRRDAEASRLEDQISAADTDYRSIQKRVSHIASLILSRSKCCPIRKEEVVKEISPLS